MIIERRKRLYRLMAVKCVLRAVEKANREFDGTKSD